MADDHHLRELAQLRVHPRRPNTLEMSTEEAARLVYELEIHQEELEIQNEELQRAQLELKHSRDRYVDLYDFAPVGYLTLDAKGEITEANLTACKLVGQERSRLIGTQLALHCEVDSRAELRAHLDNVLATGQQHSTELKVTANGGAYIHLESCRTADPGGTEYQCRTVMTDITARKKAEETALEKDRHLRSLAEALPVLISYLDSDLQFQFSNGAHRHWLGLTPDELIGRAIGEVLGDNFDPACIDYFNDALEGRTVTFECDFRHPDRGLRQIQVMLVPDLQRGHKVNGIHTLCIDITERKIVEEQNARSRVLAVMLERLSADERSVYKMLIRGEANKLIAQELDCGVRTVERRRQSILKKLEVESVAELLHKLADIRGVTD